VQSLVFTPLVALMVVVYYCWLKLETAKILSIISSFSSVFFKAVL
jgi:hypothetical protein